jgi:hypothetical protein
VVVSALWYFTTPRPLFTTPNNANIFHRLVTVSTTLPPSSVPTSVSTWAKPNLMLLKMRQTLCLPTTILHPSSPPSKKAVVSSTISRSSCCTFSPRMLLKLVPSLSVSPSKTAPVSPCFLSRLYKLSGSSWLHQECQASRSQSPFVEHLTDDPVDKGLGFERAVPDILQRPPQSLKTGIFTMEFLIDMIVYGLWITLLCLANFVLVVFGFGDGDLGTGCNETYSESCELVFRARATTFSCLTCNFPVRINCETYTDFVQGLPSSWPGK